MIKPATDIDNWSTHCGSFTSDNPVATAFSAASGSGQVQRAHLSHLHVNYSICVALSPRVRGKWSGGNLGKMLKVLATEVAVRISYDLLI